MNVDELAETTLNRDTRVLKRMTMHEATKAAKLFDVLMGSDVATQAGVHHPKLEPDRRRPPRHLTANRRTGGTAEWAVDAFRIRSWHTGRMGALSNLLDKLMFWRDDDPDYDVDGCFTLPGAEVGASPASEADSDDESCG